MRSAHEVIGWVVVGGYALLWVWAMGTWLSVRILRRGSGPGRAFWWLLAALQAALLLQGVGGVVLLFLGGRASALHYVYGFIFPALVLAFAHVWARTERWAAIPWFVFGWAGFVVSAATARALMTGFGMA